MIRTSMLILDKRKELGTKYKKTCSKLVSKVFLKSEVEEAFDIILKYEPDLLLVSDSFEVEFVDIVQKIRLFPSNYRPTIVYISKSDLIDDKLKALDSGADDYLSEPILVEELSARIKAHFRRIVETQISSVTNFYGNRLSLVVLKRGLAEKIKRSVMLVTLDYFNEYKEVYGTIAAEKLVQTYAAIISSALSNDDFVGELSSGEFLLITKPENAEKIAAYLVFAFDTVAEKFYSKKDAQNHYLICKNDNASEEKVPLVKTRISIVSEILKYTSVKQILSDLLLTLKLTKNNKKSAYAVDRIKFPKNECIESKKYNDIVAIIEPDDALCFLLSTTAHMQGYKTESYEYDDESFNRLRKKKPAVLIIDVGDLQKREGIDFCRKIKDDKCLGYTKVILTSNLHNKEEIMSAGADIYLPKPYDLLTIYSWVEKLVKDYNY